MYTVANKVRTISMNDRAGFKLTALFALTFLAFLIGWVVYDVFNSMLETNAAEANMPNPPTVVAIDPKIEAELTKVLATDSLPETATIRDPFDDQSGISNIAKTSGNAPLAQPAAATSGATRSATPPNPASNQPPGYPSRGLSAGINPGGFDSYPQPVEQEDTKTRFSTWQQTGRFAGTGEPEPQIFAIDDLIPVGVVSGGGEKQEVIFFSQAANRTFSFPVGTRFYDAWLMEVRADGVVFTFDDNYRTSRLKSWGRSVRSSGTGE